MSEEFVEVWQTTEQLDDDRMFDTPTTVCHSTRGPMCAVCGKINSPQFCGRDGVLDCQHCGKRCGFMAGPHPEGFLWSTWPLLAEPKGE